MIRDLLDDLPEDRGRRDNPFSDDMRECQEILFRPDASQAEIEAALNDWMEKHQPCLFGRMEAKRRRIALCVLTERDIFRGDEHVQRTIHRARDHWRRLALNGGSHGFVIVAISRRVANAAIGPQLFRFAKHLCRLYLGFDEADAIHHDSLILAIPNGNRREFREWKVGVNFFGAQGDGRWWRDHRFPGGIAYSMNSVGHMARYRAEQTIASDEELAQQLEAVPRDCLVYWALPTAMRTIGPPNPGSTRGTWLAQRGRFNEDAEPPDFDVHRRVFEPFAEYSENRYLGAYHTDETIPSPYFDSAIQALEMARERDDLYFTYLHNRNDPDFRTMGIGDLAAAISVRDKSLEIERRDANDGPEDAGPRSPRDN